MLADFEKTPPTSSSLCSNMEDGRIKLWINLKILQGRRRLPDLFLKGSFVPIHASGPFAHHIFAFARHFENQTLVVVVPDFWHAWVVRDNWRNIEWTETLLTLPTGIKDILTGLN